MDIILGAAALFTLYTLVRSWKTLFDDDFTGTDRRLAIQVAVFLIPPVVVLLHELGHYFVALALDVRVTAFRYGLFHGSVSVAGLRTLEDMWLIALAGNVVSAVTGLLMVVVAVTTKWRRSVRYLLLAGGLLELVFSLIVYPVMSLSGQFGDWVIIYSSRTEGLSWATGIAHGASLLGLWVWWRSRGRQAMFLIGSGTEGAVGDLRKAIDASPREPAGWLALADFYARRGELSLARSTVEEGLEACGESSRLLLGLARLSMFQGRWNDAVVAARRGLDAPGPVTDDAVRQPLWANLALALTQMERPDLALAAYEHLTPPMADDVRVRYGRGLMRMESGDVPAGRADLQHVVGRLPDGDLLRSWAEAWLDGHPLKEWGDSRVPAYQRGSAPPPAPIAGV